MGLLGKLLLTVAVIAGVLLYLRYRSLQSMPPPPREPRVVNPPPPPRRGPGKVASALVVVAILGSGLGLYRYWQEQHQVLYVRVVDAGTGHTQVYRAYRGDIDDRAFLTVDGTQVHLAETERLETTTIPPARN
jgi:hypothetical protein